MRDRRAVLVLGIAAAGTLVGCSTDDATTSPGSDGDTATQSEASAPGGGDTGPETPVGSAWGRITVTAIEQPVTVGADPTYPTDGNGHPLLDQALSEAAEDGTGGVAIETESALDAVESTLEPYPGAPDSADADGWLLRWESAYYAVTLVKLE